MNLKYEDLLNVQQEFKTDDVEDCFYINISSEQWFDLNVSQSLFARLRRERFGLFTRKEVRIILDEIEEIKKHIY